MQGSRLASQKGTKLCSFIIPRPLAQVGIDFQTGTPKTTRENVKILVLVDTFTCFARPMAIPDERAETIAQAVMKEWISVFRPMECFLSDQGPNFIGNVLSGMAEALGVRRVTISAF